MRLMAVLGFVLTLAVFMASVAGFMFLVGQGHLLGTSLKVGDIPALLERHGWTAKVSLTAAAGISFLVLVLTLIMITRPRADEKKLIHFEDELGDVVVEITALENCLQRLVLEGFPVTWAQVRLKVPPPEVDPTIQCDLSVRHREMEDLPSMQKQMKLAVRDRFQSILPLDRKMVVNAHLTLEPSPPQARRGAVRPPRAAVPVPPAPPVLRSLGEGGSHVEGSSVEEPAGREVEESAPPALSAAEGSNVEGSGGVGRRPASERSTSERLLIPSLAEGPPAAADEDDEEADGDSASAEGDGAEDIKTEKKVVL